MMLLLVYYLKLINNTYRTIGAEARKKMRDNLDNYLKQFLN